VQNTDRAATTGDDELWAVVPNRSPPAAIMKEALNAFEPEFQITRDQPEVQERQGWP